MTYTKNNDGSFTVTSRSGGSKAWTVNESMKACNCPKFKYILRGQSPCHHMSQVIEGEINATSKKISELPNGVKPFMIDEYVTPLTMVKFIEKYGVAQLDFFLSNSTIVEVRGLIRVL